MTATRSKGTKRSKGGRARDRQGPSGPNPLYLVLLAVVAVALIAGAIVAGLSLGDDDGDSVASGLTGDDFHALVLSPVEPRRVFMSGDRASTSGTGGLDWSEIRTLRGTEAMSWVVAPEAIYVSGRSGLLRSDDGGTSFAEANEGLPSTDVRALGGGGSVLYGASPEAGVFAGRPGQWEVRNAEAGRSFVGRIVVTAGDDEHLFAADASAGVAESTDGGRTWRVLDTGLSEATWVSVTGSLEVLVASGPEGAAISRDGGQSWEQLDLPEGATLVEVYPSEPRLLYTGIHDGDRVELRVSIDGGQTWTRPDANTQTTG